MSSRCGCQEQCACVIQGEYGIGVTGNGSANNPYTVQFDPTVDDILGPGLRWSSQQHELSVFRSQDRPNLLTFGSDNGLLVSGTDGGGGPANNGATVGALPKQGLACGMLGAGWSIAPDCLLSSFQQAILLGLHMTHVPVRTLKDGANVVCADGTVDRYTDHTEPLGPVTDFDVQSWKQRVRYQASFFDTLTELDHTNGRMSALHPSWGYFGNNTLPQRGGTFLADVCHHIGNRIVMSWQITNAANYDDNVRLIQRYGLWNSVIILTDLAHVDLLKPYRTLGLPLAVAFGPTDDLTQYPPSWLQGRGIEWVWPYLSAAYNAMDTVQAWIDAGLSVMPWPVKYQVEYRTFTGIGTRGLACIDPIYVFGEANQYRYRHTHDKYVYGTADYGQYCYGYLPEYSYPSWRGQKLRREGSKEVLPWNYIDRTMNWARFTPDDQPSFGERKGAWWIMQGWLSPPEVLDNYILGFEPRFRRTPVYANDDIAVAFCVPIDHDYRDGTETMGSLDVGYQIRIKPDGTAIIYRWDSDSHEAHELVNVTLEPGGFAIVDGFPPEESSPHYPMELHITPTGIDLVYKGATAGHTDDVQYIGQGGQYVYLGKHEYELDGTDPYTGGFNCAFKNVYLTPQGQPAANQGDTTDTEPPAQQ